MAQGDFDAQAATVSDRGLFVSCFKFCGRCLKLGSCLIYQVFLETKQKSYEFLFCLHWKVHGFLCAS